jgi:hypothetical protein
MTRSHSKFRFAGIVLAAALVALPGTALAERAERACVGAFVSELAQEGAEFGATVRQEAKDFRPLGKTVVSQVATTCELPEE